MATQKTASENKTDEQIWDELLNSEAGAAALDHLLEGIELDIEKGDISEDK